MSICGLRYAICVCFIILSVNLLSIASGRVQGPNSFRGPVPTARRGCDIGAAPSNDQRSRIKYGTSSSISSVFSNKAKRNRIKTRSSPTWRRPFRRALLARRDYHDTLTTQQPSNIDNSIDMVNHNSTTSGQVEVPAPSYRPLVHPPVGISLEEAYGTEADINGANTSQAAAKGLNKLMKSTFQPISVYISKLINRRSEVIRSRLPRYDEARRLLRRNFIDTTRLRDALRRCDAHIEACINRGVNVTDEEMITSAMRDLGDRFADYLRPERFDAVLDGHTASFGLTRGIKLQNATSKSMHLFLRNMLNSASGRRFALMLIAANVAAASVPFLFTRRTSRLMISLLIALISIDALLIRRMASTPVCLVESVRESAIGELSSPLLARDVISHINGHSVHSLPPEGVEAMLSGNYETHNSINVTIQRDKENFREISVPTRICTDHSCSYKHFSSTSGAVYVALRQITEFSFDEISWIIQEYFNCTHPSSGLILDLRGNGGGCAITAFDIAALFLPSNKTLCVSSKSPVFWPVSDSQRIYTRKGDGENHRSHFPWYKTWLLRNRLMHRSTNEAAFTSFPILVLVDARTASSAEIISWALRDNDRAEVWGPERTFGKASAQSFLPLSDGTCLKFTTEQYLSPRLRFMHYGLEPDNYISPLYFRPEMCLYDAVTKKWKYNYSAFSDII